MDVPNFDVKTEGKKKLGRPRRRWEDGFGKDLRGIGKEVVDKGQ
jgi:hypothetical protein